MTIKPYVPHTFSLNFGVTGVAGLGAGYAGTAQGSLVWDATDPSNLYGQGTAGGTYVPFWKRTEDQSPDPKDWVWGGGADAGFSGSISNGTPQQLAGKAHNYSIGARWLFAGYGLNYAYTGNVPWKPGVYSITITPPAVDWGAQAQTSHYNTWTSDPSWLVHF